MNTPQLPPLTITTLGRFIIHQNNTPLPDTIWTRGKALTLFQYLLTHHGRMLPKERIVTDLWPALNANQAERDFKVALNAIGAALDPNRPARTLARYLSRQGSSYGLNPDETITTDAHQFEQTALQASQLAEDDPTTAITLYRQALQPYHGPYLPDTLYEDWSTPRRETLETLFMTSATHLANLLLTTQAHVEAIHWCQQVLALDNCWEEAYRLMMRSYIAQNNRPAAIRLYQKCKQTLSDELNLPPMPATQKLYQQIIQ
ncbi:MAG TPA: BTAD domain-containing putative transcriptional regulator [Anaerolineae bacterium]|nr:BTAD domain-containing putative transcriptional regulator [Anaerolineae bacterium]